MAKSGIAQTPASPAPAEEAPFEGTGAAQPQPVDETPQSPSVNEQGFPATDGGAGQEIDDNLFPDMESVTEAEDVWGQGIEEGKKANPVGTFQAEIVEATLGRSTSSDRLQIHYKLRILVGDYKDVEIDKYDGLSTSQSAKITQTQLQKLGVRTEGLRVVQLPAVLLNLVGRRVQIATKQNGEFYNIYFQKVLTQPLAGGTAPAPTAARASAAARNAPVAGAGTRPAGRRF